MSPNSIKFIITFTKQTKAAPFSDLVKLMQKVLKDETSVSWRKWYLKHSDETSDELYVSIVTWHRLKLKMNIVRDGLWYVVIASVFWIFLPEKFNVRVVIGFPFALLLSSMINFRRHNQFVRYFGK